MLEIIVHSGYSLDLPSDFSLSIIDENPLFLEDRIPSPYSVQFEVPNTAKNLQVFGLPNRIASNGLKKRLPADIIHFGYIIARGELLLMGAEESPKLQFVGNVITVNMGKNLNQIDLGTYDYGDFPLVATDIDYADSWATTYKAAMITAATTGVPFAVAPMRIKGATWEGEDTKDGIKNSLRLYINFFNLHAHNFYVYTERVLAPYTRAHSPILPMPYLKDIIDAAFGTALLSNPFATGDYANLVLPSYNHKNYSYDNLLGFYPDHMLNPVLFFNPLVEDYNYNGTLWRDLMFKMQSFQQAYPFTSLLKSILKMFSMTMFSGTKFSIERNDDIMNRNVVIDWNDKIAGIPIKSYEAAKDYVFNYGDFSNASTVNVQQYADMKAIYTKVFNGDENVDYVCQDTSTGGIYKLNVLSVLNVYDTNKVIRSEVQQSPNCVYYAETDREKYEVTSEVKPIDMNIHQCWSREFSEKMNHWFVPEIELGDIKSPPYLMFRSGMSETFEEVGSYPQLLAHNYDQFGVKKFDFSLLPGGADGLIAKFHTKFKQWVEKDKLCLKASVRLKPAELRSLNFRDKYHIGGKLFYIRKNEYQLTHTSISLVESDLIEA